MHLYVERYGCTQLQAETDMIADALVRAGWEVAKSPESADIILLGTCVVIEHTERRMVRRVRELLEYSRPLYVYGCLASVRGEALREMGAVPIPAWDWGAVKVHLGVEARDMVPVRGAVASIPIANGCAGACAYCVTRLIRRGLESEPPEVIVDRVRRAVRAGAREIRLTAQDTASYGLDRGTDLPSLLRAVLEGVRDRYRVRVGMMDPRTALRVYRDLIDVWEDGRIYRFLHLPVQSGSDSVLRDMRRGYTVSDFLKIVEGFREVYPDLTLSTDVIVGYPTEDEEDFRETVRLVEEVRPDILNITRFSPRPGTPAANLKPLPGGVVKERSRLLTDLHAGIALERNRDRVGTVDTALVVEPARGGVMARDSTYRPVVLASGYIGRFYRVRITGYGRVNLFGEVTGPAGPV